MDSVLFPTGNIEILDDSSDINKGIYVTLDDLERYKIHLERLKVYLEDNLDQNMMNYCDFVVFMDIYNLFTNKSKNNSYITVCDCCK
jgi:hypothetical protein